LTRKDEGRDAALAIVHRDVSPQNILLSHEAWVKIADFGIATANLFREGGRPQGRSAHVARAGPRSADRSARATSTRSAISGARSPGSSTSTLTLLKAVQQQSAFEPPSTRVRMPPDQRRW
jgi:serine/threonine protein kinase